MTPLERLQAVLPLSGRIPDAAYRALFGLAFHAEGYGPSVAQVAQVTAQSERTTQEGLRWLEAQGYVTGEARTTRSGATLPRLYSVRWSKVGEGATTAPPATIAPGATTAPGGVRPPQGEGATTAPTPGITPGSIPGEVHPDRSVVIARAPKPPPAQPDRPTGEQPLIDAAPAPSSQPTRAPIWPHPAAELLAARCPELAELLRQPTAWRVADQLDPEDVRLVVAWALDSPDADAARLRLEQRAIRRVGKTSRATIPRFKPSWLLDPIGWAERLVQARAWHAQGGAVAEDHLQAAPEGVGVHATLQRQAEALAGRLASAHGVIFERLREHLRLYRDAGVIDDECRPVAYPPPAAPTPERRAPRAGGWGSVGALVATFPGGDP